MSEPRATYEAIEERVHVLEAAVQECERLSVSNRYAAAVMHEVNNPLEAITNLVYLLQGEPLTNEGHEHLRMLEEQITVLTAVTRPSLTFYRDHKATKQVDLVGLIDSVAKLHEVRLQKAGIELHRRCPDSMPCNIIGSELLQVLSNLVLNAVDALVEAGQGSHIHIRLRYCPSCISLLIADDGPGIPEHVEAKLFQAHSTGKATGSGLGLWISDRIIQNHHGKIRHRTCRRPGRSGTAFRIHLPCEKFQTGAVAA